MKEISRNEALTLGSPYPYTLVTVLDRKGRPNAIGLAWWTFVSWNPCMIAIAVGNGKYSHTCLMERKEFVINFPSEEHARGAWICGTKSGKDLNKIEAAKFKMVPSLKIETPTIENSTVAYECKITNTIEIGDHTTFIADVVAMKGCPDKKMHLASVHYTKLISFDCEGNINTNVQFK